MKSLHPKFIWKLFAPIIIFSFITFIVIIAFYVSTSNPGYSPGRLFWILCLLVFFSELPIIYIWAKLTHHFYHYGLTEEGFQQESGIIWKRYVTIPYGRIQNIDIYRGVWDRLLGLSVIHIQTAGASRYPQTHFSEGRLPGLSVEEAKQVRKELIERVNKSKSSGGV